MMFFKRLFSAFMLVSNVQTPDFMIIGNNCFQFHSKCNILYNDFIFGVITCARQSH